MADERFRFPLRADSGELGPDGFLKLQGYHELLCRTVELDQMAYGSSINETLALGYAWAIISLSMQVERPVNSCGLLTGQTWLCEANHPYYRREIKITDEQEHTVLCASIFMVPLNATTHHIEPAETLVKDGIPIGGEHTVDWAQPRARKIPASLFEHIDTQLVRPSDIDALGHLNNCRYGAYTYDAAIMREKNVFSSPFRYSMYFMRQCMLGEHIDVGCYTGEDGIFNVNGTGDSDGRIHFFSSLSAL